jgi:uncharacterized membrane protein YkoI
MPLRHAVAALALSGFLAAPSPVMPGDGYIAPAEARRIAEARYEARVIALDRVARGRGADKGAVYAIRLLTEEGAVLLLRLDARDGRFLSIEGPGYVEVIRRP